MLFMSINVAPLSILFLVLLGTLATGNLDVFTLQRNDSYLKFSQWIPRGVVGGRAELQFKTSSNTAALIYASNSNRGTKLYIGLLNGCMHLILQKGDTFHESVGLLKRNDDKWHMLEVIYMQGDLTAGIDAAGPEVMVSFKDFSVDDVGPLYVGGLPSPVVLANSSIAASVPSLIGCIREVKAANGSDNGFTYRHSTKPIDLHSSHFATIGDSCVGPCERRDDPCNGGGLCHGNWSDDSYHCTCTRVDRKGRHCSESITLPVPLTPMRLTGLSYSCRRLPASDFPFSDVITIHLSRFVFSRQGTLLTLHGRDGTSAVLMATKNYLTLTVYTRIFQRNYQAQIPLSGGFIKLVKDVTSLQLISAAHNSTLLLLGDTVPMTTRERFPILCVGGGAMEQPLFEGYVNAIIYNDIDIRNKAGFVEIFPRTDANVSQSEGLYMPRYTFQDDNISFTFQTNLSTFNLLYMEQYLCRLVVDVKEEHLKVTSRCHGQGVLYTSKQRINVNCLAILRPNELHHFSFDASSGQYLYIHINGTAIACNTPSEWYYRQFDLTTDPSTWAETTPEVYIGRSSDVSDGNMYVANISISGGGNLHLEMLLDPDASFVPQPLPITPSLSPSASTTPTSLSPSNDLPSSQSHTVHTHLVSPTNQATGTLYVSGSYFVEITLAVTVSMVLILVLLLLLVCIALVWIQKKYIGLHINAESHQTAAQPSPIKLVPQGTGCLPHARTTSTIAPNWEELFVPSKNIPAGQREYVV